MNSLHRGTLWYQGHPLRILETEPDPYVVDARPSRLIPLNDVADTLGRHRVGVSRMVQRDPVLTELSTTAVTAAVDGKAREFTCLTYEGVVLLITKLNASRSTTAAARLAVARSC